MGLDDIQILGLFLILIVYVGFLLYCDNHRSRCRTKDKNHHEQSESMSAAEIGVAASYLSDSGGYSSGGAGGGD